MDSGGRKKKADKIYHNLKTWESQEYQDAKTDETSGVWAEVGMRRPVYPKNIVSTFSH
jgi:hypothetical protein